MREELSTITTWAAAIANCLEQLDVPPRPLFEQAGLDFAQLTNIDARYPVSGMTRLWRAAADSTGLPDIGLRVAEHLQPGALHALGSAVLASESLADTFQRLDRYSRMVSNAGRWEVDETADPVQATLEVVEQGVIVADEAVDAFMGAAVRIGRLMSAGQHSIVAVGLHRRAPANTETYQRFFGCPIHFDQQGNCLSMDARLWTAKLRGANPAVAQATERLVEDYLARMDRDRIGFAVRSQLIRKLPSGEPNLSQIAHALNMSNRSLQRKLGAEGLSFSALLDETRKEMAQAYLARPGHRLSEVAFLLGFADQSNFNRAFRRWMDTSPGEYRAARLAG